MVYNGEVYNHLELRSELSARGESFSQRAATPRSFSDCWSAKAFPRSTSLNGQFAIGWWQPQHRRLTLVRDRFGVRPLYYALLRDGGLVFGSEAKALFASGEVDAEVDLLGIDEVFMLWGPRAPRTVFRGIRQVEPGGLVVWEEPAASSRRRVGGAPVSTCNRIEAQSSRSCSATASDCVCERTCRSGRIFRGLDSSLVTALAQAETEHELRTFHRIQGSPGTTSEPTRNASPAESGPATTPWRSTRATSSTAFPDVVRHVEMPVVRTAPVPLFLLARDVRAQHITVVATGEGADELFWGYDLFKEVAFARPRGARA